MKRSVVPAIMLVAFICFSTGSHAQKAPATKPAKMVFQEIRGFNYTPANDRADRHHIDQWLSYDERKTEFDMDLARKLNLNQVRVMIPYRVYLGAPDKNILKDNLRKFVRVCEKRGIGVMVCAGSGDWIKDTTLRSQGLDWVKFLVDALSKEPGLKFWDAMNEPDWPTGPADLVRTKVANAKFMARAFKQLDPKTPVTIGCAFKELMMELANYADLLQFHDYSETRGKIRANLQQAKHFADSAGKPLVDGEIGCIARANPYDVALEEHSKAGVGWYIWELMIVPSGWGIVHGVFYEDGTVRDPSVAAAILGFFRKRDGEILQAVPDREGKLSRVMSDGYTWLGKNNAAWSEGLDIAETAANLLESGELIAMNMPPTLEVARLRQLKSPDPQALRILLQKYLAILNPFIVKKNAR